MAKKKTETPGFPKKLYKLLGEGVGPEMNAMNAKQLEDRMIECEESIHETETAMGEDEEIVRVREELKEIRGPYTDAIKAQRATIKYALYLRAQEGQ